MEQTEPLQEAAAAVEPTPAHARSVEITLSNGKVIELGPPEKASIGTAVAAMMADLNISEKNVLLYAEERSRARALCYVRSVAGVRREGPPANGLERKLLEQELGIDGVDAVTEIWLEEFPPISRDQIKVVKKY